MWDDATRIFFLHAAIEAPFWRIYIYLEYGGEILSSALPAVARMVVVTHDVRGVS